MKITLPGMEDGGIQASNGRVYRIKNHVAHVMPIDFEGLGLHEMTFEQVKDHPLDPNQKLRTKIAPIVLASETEPVYTDDPEGFGDFSHPDDSVDAKIASRGGKASLLDLVKAMSPEELDAMRELFAGSDAEDKPKTRSRKAAAAAEGGE